ncbi:MAG: Fe-S cluster assembly protein HesB [Chlorobium sp.]
MVHPPNIELFQEKVFAFYREKRRMFPWRETTDRYAVMISEIMLQQTQAERVVPRFKVWLENFPDISALAGAPLKDVLALWSGLGYNSRAVRLHRCASVIMEGYGGVVPSTPELLKKLPGIGEYTSRSIPVFADNRDFAAVDTNIRRILIHEFTLPEDISAARVQQIAESVLPHGQSCEWHNALMDYGALYLTSKKTGIRSLTRQSKFGGSRRWYRGQLVKELIRSDVIFLEELKDKYADCPWNLDEILSQLVYDGLVEHDAATSSVSNPGWRIKGG